MRHACSEYVFSNFVNENIENDVKLEEVKIDIDCMSTNLEKQGIIVLRNNLRIHCLVRELFKEILCIIRDLF